MTRIKNPDSCGVFIVPMPMPAEMAYEAIPNGTPPFSFEWSNGQTTSQIIVPEFDPTIYCVTITDATGCVSTACTDSFPPHPCSVDIEIDGGTLTANPSSSPVDLYWVPEKLHYRFSLKWQVIIVLM
ncbi:MAG: hypothetical protein R2784_11250 [Saprospiraceae bacterium]